MSLLKKNSMLVCLMILFMLGCNGDGPTPPTPPNNSPTITDIEITSNLDIENDQFISGETVAIEVTATDPENDNLTYSYKLDGETITGTDNTAEFIATTEGIHTLVVQVNDGNNSPADTSIEIPVCNSTSLGIYSDGEHCKLLLDQNSFLGLYSGGGADVVEFVDDTNEKCEGNLSKKMTINVAATNEWAGWFVQYGVSGTLNSFNRDVTLFDGGTLRFCIKSEINDLIVSLRSGNVAAGNEHNVRLSTVSGFQVGSWIEISVPLVQFTDPPPGKAKADLSQLKVLFNIASSQESGGTNGTQSFWIDNIRLVRSGF